MNWRFALTTACRVAIYLSGNLDIKTGSKITDLTHATFCTFSVNTILLLKRIYYSIFYKCQTIINKKSLKIPKWQSEFVHRRRTDNTKAKRKKTMIHKTYT